MAGGLAGKFMCRQGAAVRLFVSVRMPVYVREQGLRLWIAIWTKRIALQLSYAMTVSRWKRMSTAEEWFALGFPRCSIVSDASMRFTTMLAYRVPPRLVTRQRSASGTTCSERM